MIFRRSLVNELANSAGGVFTVLFSIVLTVGLVQILGEAADGSVDSATVFELVAYSSLVNLPPLVALSLFMAVLMVLMRSWQDSEMVVWFSSAGLSLLSWIRPVLRFALPMILVVGILSIALTPWAKSQIERTTEAFQQKEDVNRIAPERFIETAGGQRVFFIEDAAEDGSRIHNVFMSERKDGAEIIVHAGEGAVRTNDAGDRYIALSDGRRYETDPDKGASWKVLDFARYDMLIRVKADTALTSMSVDMMPVAMLTAINTNAANAELLWRLCWPLAALNLVLLAIPLSYTNPRAGRSLSMVIAVLIFILYLNGISIAETWVRGGKISWVTGLIALNGGVFLLTALLFVRRVWLVRWLPLKLTELPYKWIGRDEK